MTELDKIEDNRLETFRKALDERDFLQIRSLFKDAEPADIADYYADVSMEEAIVLFRLASRKVRPQLFSYLPFERQEELLESLPDDVVTTLVNEMEPDDRTALLQDLPVEIRRRMLQRLSPEERKIAWKLLSYPEDSVGRIMNPDFLGLRADMKVASAIEFIRWNTSSHEDLWPYVFVTDSAGKLKGSVSLAALLMADAPGQTLESVMEAVTVTVRADENRISAVDIIRKYDRVHVPVVNEEDVLLGVVTADDVFDVAEEEATEDIQQFGGQATLEDSYFQTPLMTLVRKRAGWLAFIFVGEMFAGTVMRHYDEAIASARFLVYFIPLIISSGGNSGSQSASLIIRGIAIKEMHMRDWWRVSRREFMAGLMLGVLLGVLGYARAVTWGHSHAVGLVVALTLIGIVLLGSVVGGLLPFIFKSMKLDPAVCSSPLIATIVDVFGIVMFFSIATAFLGAQMGGG